MNKKALVLAVAAGLAAPVTFAAATANSSTSEKVHNNQDSVISAKTIYTGEKATLQLGGRADARMLIVDGDVADITRVRFNLKGNVYLKNGLYGVGYYEGQYEHNTGGYDLDHRYTYAGIGGDFGEVTYGQNDGALGLVTDFTDIMAYHGGVAGGTKLPVGDRAENMIAYKGTFDNVSIRASYRFEDTLMADGYSLSGTYGFNNGFKAGLGFASQDELDQFNVALSYETGGFYFAGLYMDLEDISGFELAAAYTTGPFVFSTTYGLEEFDSHEIDEDIAVDVTYYFSTNFRTYASYNHTLMDGEEDQIVLGLRYDF